MLDSSQFAKQLANAAADSGDVTFLNGPEHAVQELELSSDNTRIERILTSGGERVESDLIVLSAGSESARLSRSVGIALPIYPVKGYSLTVEAAEGVTVPEGLMILERGFHAVVAADCKCSVAWHGSEQ